MKANTETEKTINILGIQSAEVRVDNANDTDRAFAVAALVRVDNGKVTSVSQGTIAPPGSTNGMSANLATFDSWSEESLNINYQTATDRAAIMEAAETFIATVRNNSFNI